MTIVIRTGARVCFVTCLGIIIASGKMKLNHKEQKQMSSKFQYALKGATQAAQEAWETASVAPRGVLHSLSCTVHVSSRCTRYFFK